ncbi:hypothetical protein RUND412_001107 [Rhizina undulata]
MGTLGLEAMRRALVFKSLEGAMSYTLNLINKAKAAPRFAVTPNPSDLLGIPQSHAKYFTEYKVQLNRPNIRKSSKFNGAHSKDQHRQNDDWLKRKYLHHLEKDGFIVNFSNEPEEETVFMAFINALEEINASGNHYICLSYDLERKVFAEAMRTYRACKAASA